MIAIPQEEEDKLLVIARGFRTTKNKTKRKELNQLAADIIKPYCKTPKLKDQALELLLDLYERAQHEE